MNLFYTPEISGDEYQLDEAESKHCIRVLRHQSGDVLHLVDGRGNWYETIITDDNPKRCMVKVTSVKREFGKSNFYSHIAIAPTKNIDRLEWFLEKATEIGMMRLHQYFANIRNARPLILNGWRKSWLRP
jgi:16S rRNA (uracil1498-N3)-methyltransferase